MRRYFFDTHVSGRNDITDPVGMLLETETDACLEAMRRLPVMSVDLPMADGEYRTWTVTIRDETGTAVFRYIMAIIGDRIGSTGQRTLHPI